MAKLTFEEMNQRLLGQMPGLVEVWLPGGKVSGKEYSVRNPMRGDQHSGSFAINIQTGQWADFACGDKGGDLVSLYAYLHGIKNGQALAELSGTGFPIQPPSNVYARPVVDDEWQQIVPVPDSVPDPDGIHFKYGKPEGMWMYLTPTGGLIGAVCRWMVDGKKQIMPICWCRHRVSKKEQWRWRHFNRPRPLYNLDLITDRPDARVWIVEGEKCADACQRLFPDDVATSWPGGAKAVKYVDWTPLKGRRVILWPDNDVPGRHAAAEIYSILTEYGCEISRYEPLVDRAQGWDCADAEYEGLKPADIMANVASGVELVPEKADPIDGYRWPFSFLGYDHGEYFYQSQRQNQVIRLSAASHNKAHLITLATLAWWESSFNTDGKGCNWLAAADAMMSHQLHPRGPGPYNPNNIHGRGASLNGKQKVIHCGNKLIVDGQEMELTELKSEHIYERRPKLDLPKDNPLPSEDSKQLLDIVNRLSWEKPVYGDYLAGWLALAPICGALKWRPHVWLTGAAGSGKTWVVEHIVKKVLGSWCIYVYGESSEAGIRQGLNSDALPVLIDEAEKEQVRQKERLEAILFLARQASSESGAQVLRGSLDGHAVSFKIRSMFCLAAISPNAVHQADASRVSILTLNKNIDTKAEDRFCELKAISSRFLTDEFGRRMVKRMLGMIDIVRHNADVFSEVISRRVKDKRLGDQYGALYAGRQALLTDDRVSDIEAARIIDGNDWMEEKVVNEIPDEYQCMRTLMQHGIQVQLADHSENRTIGELIATAIGEPDKINNQLSSKVAADSLRRNGIKVELEAGRVLFATSSLMIRRALTGTNWEANYGRHLKRITGAECGNCALRFNAGLVSRYVSLPISTVMEDEMIENSGGKHE